MKHSDALIGFGRWPHFRTRYLFRISAAPYSSLPRDSVSAMAHLVVRSCGENTIKSVIYWDFHCFKDACHHFNNCTCSTRKCQNAYSIQMVFLPFFLMSFLPHQLQVQVIKKKGGGGNVYTTIYLLMIIIFRTSFLHFSAFHFDVFFPFMFCTSCTVS